MMQLPDHHQPARRIALSLGVIETASRLEVAQPHMDAGILHLIPQHADGPAVIEGIRDHLGELLPRHRLTTMTRHQLPPRLRLGRLDERHHLVREQAQLAVITGRRHLRPAVAQQVRLDVGLERGLVRDHRFLTPESRCRRSSRPTRLSPQR